jgi:peptidoglycan hydrolase-like protein with peptidoglycan-binding domain
VLALGGVLAATGAGAAESKIGPSFACPTPRDPLGQLICGNALLAERDLAFVQAYQALRQQSSPSEQIGLRSEAIAFGKSVRLECGIAMPGSANDTPPAEAAACVEREYAHQRAAWTARLDGAAAEEAARPLALQLSLQKDLQTIGLLAASEPINGVYASSTRAAITAFQATMGLPVTGLLGERDAQALSREAISRTRKDPTPPPRSAWDDFLGGAAAMGVKPEIASGESCSVAFQIRGPASLAEATAEYVRGNGGTLEVKDEAKLFAAEIAFLQTEFSTRMVHAFYLAQPTSIDRCEFAAMATTTDIYGRDVSQKLFAFAFDRATYDKIVWNRFDPANLPKIALSLEIDGYTSERLRSAEQPTTKVADPPDAHPTETQPPPRHPRTRRAAAPPP